MFHYTIRQLIVLLLKGEVIQTIGEQIIMRAHCEVNSRFRQKMEKVAHRWDEEWKEKGDRMSCAIGGCEKHLEKHGDKCLEHGEAEAAYFFTGEGGSG